MVAFPAKNDFFPEGAGNTGPVRAGQRGFYDAVRQMPGANASAALTIAAGAVTPTRYLHTIDTEGAAAADDLTNILQDNLPEGALISIGSVDGARVPTVKHSAGGAGQILLADGTDFLLLHPSMRLVLRRDGTTWVEEARAYGSQKAAARTHLDVDQATNSLTAEAAADDADLVAVYDSSAGAMRKMTRANLLASLSGNDQTARDMAILNAFDISELMGRSALSLGAAVVDAFEDQTGIDAAASTGELFDAAAGTYGTVADVTQTDNRARTSTLYGAGREFVDLFQAATNDAVIQSISVYTTVAFAGQVAVYRDNGAGNYTVMAEQAAVHAGAGWQTFTLSSPYTVPSSGTYYVGCYRPAATFEVVTGGGAGWQAAVGVGASFTKDINDTVPCAFVETATSAAMTLVSEAITAAAAPASARVTLDHEDVAGTAVLNTDVIVSASRDDGTTYTAAVLTVLRDAGSGRKVYVADIDLSGQPSGT
ncbi:hypothetical protein, partial [Shumkonia mesophila]|uniref:hypothetical protein n=1 Tax=Shumkonia mesophila TaxID=2838854 RepID=UPI0029349634